MSSVFKATIENKTTSVTTHFKEIINREKTCLLSQLLSRVTHMLQFLHQNVQFVRLAAWRPTQPGNATDQWHDRWNAAIVCLTQWRLPASAGWLSFINHLLKGTPNSAIDWIQIRAVWGPHVRLDERDVLTPQVRRCVPGCVWRRAVLPQTSVQDASATPAGYDSYFRQ